MKWAIQGADKQTGEARNITVEADDQRAALAAASDKGIAVSSIYSVKPEPVRRPPPTPATPPTQPVRRRAFVSERDIFNTAAGVCLGMIAYTVIKWVFVVYVLVSISSV